MAPYALKDFRARHRLLKHLTTDSKRCGKHLLTFAQPLDAADLAQADHQQKLDIQQLRAKGRSKDYVGKDPDQQVTRHHGPRRPRPHDNTHRPPETTAATTPSPSHPTDNSTPTPNLPPSDLPQRTHTHPPATPTRATLFNNALDNSEPDSDIQYEDSVNDQDHNSTPPTPTTPTPQDALIHYPTNITTDPHTNQLTRNYHRRHL